MPSRQEFLRPLYEHTSKVRAATAGKEPTMADIVFLLASVAFFAAFIGMTYFFERVRKYK
jgi:heme/copper-type cytochrome/quinol oxidase subunit 3